MVPKVVDPKSETIWFHMGANGTESEVDTDTDTESESETYAQRLALSKRGPQAAQPPTPPCVKTTKKESLK